MGVSVYVTHYLTRVPCSRLVQTAWHRNIVGHVVWCTRVPHSLERLNTEGRRLDCIGRLDHSTIPQVLVLYQVVVHSLVDIKDHWESKSSNLIIRCWCPFACCLMLSCMPSGLLFSNFYNHCGCRRVFSRLHLPLCTWLFSNNAYNAWLLWIAKPIRLTQSFDLLPLYNTQHWEVLLHCSFQPDVSKCIKWDSHKYKWP